MNLSFSIFLLDVFNNLMNFNDIESVARECEGENKFFNRDKR